MTDLVKFYLASGTRHPNESELQQKPLARLISHCIANNAEFSGKHVEAGFSYPVIGSEGVGASGFVGGFFCVIPADGSRRVAA